MKRHRNMKRWLLLWLALSVICVGCYTRDKNMSGEVEDNPLSKEEIIDYVKDFFLQNYNDEVEAEIVSKRGLTYKHSTFVMDGSVFGGKYVPVKGASEYTLKVTNPEYNISVNVTYKDGYHLESQGIRGELIEREGPSEKELNDYVAKKNEKNLEKELAGILEKGVSKYHISKNPANARDYRIFIYETDSNRIYEALKQMVGRCGDDRYILSADGLQAYVFTDGIIYDALNFDLVESFLYLDANRGIGRNGLFKLMFTETGISEEPNRLIDQCFLCETVQLKSSNTLFPGFFATEKWAKENDYNRFFYVFRGDLQRYQNYLHGTSIGSASEAYGSVNVYGFDLPKKTE